jgi:Right handed beta helix region
MASLMRSLTSTGNKRFFGLRVPFSVIAVVLAMIGQSVLTTSQTSPLLFVSPAGSDSNPGSELQPFATIQHAADVVTPGDTVVVEDGTYTGLGAGTPCASATDRPVVCLTRGGTASAWVTFQARHPYGAKIDGQQNRSTHGFRFLNKANFIRIEGFEVFGLGSTNSGVSAFLIYSGGHDVTIARNDIHDIGRLCTDHIYGMSGVFIENAHVTIDANRIHDIGRYAMGENGCHPRTLNYQNHDHGLYISGKADGSAPGAADVLVTNNTFSRFERGWAIQIYPAAVSRLSVLDNTFAFANPFRDGHIIFAASTSDARVENNVFYGPRHVALNFTFATHTNLQVKNNRVFDAKLMNIRPLGALVTPEVQEVR